MSKADYPPMTEEQRRLAAENLGLVGEVATRMSVRHSLWEELYSAGCLGLVVAAIKYDPTRSKFSTYAWGWIHSYAQQELKMHKRGGAVNFPEFVPDRRDGPDIEAIRAETVEVVRSALDGLPARHREVMEGMSRGESQRESAGVIGVSQMRISQIRQKCRNRLARDLAGVA